MTVTKAQQEAFLKIMIPIAQEQAKKHDNKIFASVCIGQAIHESGWGTSQKMVNANALYGIKVGKSAYKFGTAWKGAAYKTGTTEYYDGVNPTKITDWFRSYDNVKDATEDYFDMLCHCQRYKAALNRSTPAECINAIVAGGYATGPQYAKKVMQIIKDNNLTQYDAGGSTVSKPENIDKPVNGNPYNEPTKNVRHNSKGNDVRWVQFQLNRHGYKLVVDGVAGDYTIGAVLDFQMKHGLTIDGIVGPATRAKLSQI